MVQEQRPQFCRAARQPVYHSTFLRILNERHSNYMTMTTKLTTLFLGVAALTLSAGLSRAEDPLDPETKARVDRFEKGPATIDVSKYPDGIKDNYEVFSTKCTQCHKLSRPINSDYAMPEEWSRYVKRMMH